MILVTGGTGLIGAHLLYDLVKRGKSVRALVRSGSAIEKVKRTFLWYDHNGEALFSKIEWAQGDVLDPLSIENTLENVTQVYHCAGLVSFKKQDHKRLILINQQGTANLVNACLGKGNIRFCHVSSVSALGRTKSGETINEQSFWKTSKNNSVYSISKYGAEREVWRAAEEGLNMFIVSPSIVIGPGDWNNGSSKLFNTIYKGIPVYSDGITGYVDVRDVVKIMISLMDSEVSGERYVVSAEDFSYHKLFSTTAKALGKKPPSLRLYPWMTELAWRTESVFSMFGKPQTITKEIARSAFNRYYYDSSKIKKLLDYKFIPIEKSIVDTAGIFLNEIAK
jgi:nucleoside-diphosphate-sugar epimerase